MSVADAASPGAQNEKTGVEYGREYDVIVAHMKGTFPKVDTSSELDVGAERGRKALERLHRRSQEPIGQALPGHSSQHLSGWPLFKSYYSQNGGGNSASPAKVSREGEKAIQEKSNDGAIWPPRSDRCPC